MNTLIFWVQIQEAHTPRHINVQRNILKFKSSLFREDAMGEVELVYWVKGGMCAVLESLQYFLHKIYDRQGARGSLCNSCKSTEEAGGKVVSVQFMQIYRRSREVGQSYLTSVETTLLAMSHASWLMIRIRPQVVLCNGPGTCVPLCIIAFLFKGLLVICFLCRE
ncbi:hypothetical protein POTOM_008482 [Populus tomentosa]|uniref:UDP-N-acetylglucosamine transferase subunit ALG14 n=1 Tax=Populus tomentosa TaxID=118781 RepID=A0A8X8AT92_POPTO|nr:hypothetical protein POTOM_008482 [Populus tomentosa]